MRFPRITMMPASAVQDWLDHELEMRGIDAVVYTRYILSILQQDGFEVEPADHDPFPVIVRKKDPCPGKGNKGKGHKRPARTSKLRDCDEMKKSAAVECLLSVSEQKCGIEELVDELCSRLKSIQCEGIFAQKEFEVTTALKSYDVQPDVEGQVDSSPQEQAEKYYAAFPALGGGSESDGKETSAGNGPNTRSAWSGKKLVLGPPTGVEPEAKDPDVPLEHPAEENLPSFIVPEIKSAKTACDWKWKLLKEDPWRNDGMRDSNRNEDALCGIISGPLTVKSDTVASIWQVDVEGPAVGSSPVQDQTADCESGFSSLDRIWECAGADKFIKGGVYGFAKVGEAKEGAWDPMGDGGKIWERLEWERHPPRNRCAWDEYGMTWEPPVLNGTWAGKGPSEVVDVLWGDSLAEPEPAAEDARCTLPFHNGDSRFVEVVPRKGKDPLPEPAEPPAKSTSSSSMSPDATSDGEENLLISPRTHFRPIRQDSRDLDSSSSGGDEGAALGEETVQLPQPMAEVFAEDEDGSLIDARRGRSRSPNRYMVFRGASSPTGFQPKFKLRWNLEKFCQTDEAELGIIPADEPREEETVRDEEELFQVIRNVTEMDLDEEEDDPWDFPSYAFGMYEEDPPGSPQGPGPEDAPGLSLFDFQDLDDSTPCLPTIPSNKIIYSWDLEEEWKNAAGDRCDQVQGPRRQSAKKGWAAQRRPCSFFMEGNCRRTDCKFSHDLASITCRFWEEGSCFKGLTCPFLHGYPTLSSPAEETCQPADVNLECEDEFPSLSKRAIRKSRDFAVTLSAGKGRKKRICTPRPRSSLAGEDDTVNFLAGSH